MNTLQLAVRVRRRRFTRRKKYLMIDSAELFDEAQLLVKDFYCSDDFIH